MPETYCFKVPVTRSSINADVAPIKARSEKLKKSILKYDKVSKDALGARNPEFWNLKGSSSQKDNLYDYGVQFYTTALNDPKKGKYGTFDRRKTALLAKHILQHRDIQNAERDNEILQLSSPNKLNKFSNSKKYRSVDPDYDQLNINPEIDNLTYVANSGGEKVKNWTRIDGFSKFERPNYLFKSRMNHEDYQNMIQRIEWLNEPFERQKVKDLDRYDPTQPFETSHSMKRLLEKLDGGLSSGENRAVLVRSIKNQMKIHNMKILNMIADELIEEMIPILNKKELFEENRLISNDVKNLSELALREISEYKNEFINLNKSGKIPSKKERKSNKVVKFL